MARSDAELQREVLRELEWDSQFREAEVGVAVDCGIVVLSGTLPSLEKRRAAQQAAHRVPGVLDVANEIQVKEPGSGRTDAQIARTVRDALIWNVLVPDTKIRSTVSAGEVLLEGKVESRQQREDAERALCNLAGVVRVLNSIEVFPAPSRAS
jgi:osmotically-inducible protein OsmY